MNHPVIDEIAPLYIASQENDVLQIGHNVQTGIDTSHGVQRVIDFVYSEGSTYVVLACGCTLSLSRMPMWERVACECLIKRVLRIESERKKDCVV